MIVLNMIARNCAGTVARALDSIKEAVDFYVIGFAGKSDDLTREVVVDWLEKNAPGQYIVDEFEFEDFKQARNRALEMIPETFRVAPNTWMVWLDSDDVVKGADELKGIVDSAPDDVGAIQFPYVYQTDEHGNPLVIHDRERVVRLSLGWFWNRRVHETLQTYKQHRIVRLDNLTWLHDWQANNDTRSTRNMELLFKELENENEPRTKLYIGHSYYSNEKWDLALQWFSEYYYEPANELEQWQAAVFAGDAAFQLDDMETAKGWYLQAIDVRPELVDPYLGVAACYVKQDEASKAIAWYRMADDGKQLPPTLLFVLPGRYTFNRWCYEHFALAQQGFYREAIEVCQKALEYAPNHSGFIYYQNGYQEAVDRIKSEQALEHLVYHLQKRGDALAAAEILRYAPKSIAESERITELQNRATRAVEHLFNPEVDIYSKAEHWAGSTQSDLYEREPERMSRVKAVFDRLDKIAAERRRAGKNLTVVDLGCGDGVIAIRMAEKYGWLVTGVDTNPANIERASKLAAERGVADKTRFVVANASSLDLSEVGAHDVAIVLEVIEHVIDPAMIVGTALDLAEKVIVTTPHQQVGGELTNTPDGVHLHHVREFDFGMLLRLAVGLGVGVNTLTTVYTEFGETVLPGYGSWFFELSRNVADKMPVVFYAGDAAEKWTPEQINGEGIGGSETALVEMAKRFRKAGHAVFVYGPVDGVWDGVFYRNFKHFVADGPAAGAGALLFVSSRIPEVFDVKINAAVKWLWSHDNTFRFGSYERLTPERAEEIDSILVLSEWQKRSFAEQYPFAADKLLVTANGIDPGRFEGLEQIEREPHRFVWSSSFDRGLERVLAMWPKVREMLPDATLHIYYGMETADRIYGARNPAWNELRRKLVEGFGQEGVEYHGRMAQNQLPAEFARAGYWLYPTSFAETYCITAVEVQAAGVFPVTSAAGALPERMMNDWPCLTGDDELFLERIAELEEEGAKREALIAHGLSQTWDKVYEQWKRQIDKSVKAGIKRRKSELVRQQEIERQLNELREKGVVIENGRAE